MTTVSDLFNRADGDSLGGDWTEAQGDADISTNRLVVVTGGFTDVICVHNTSLSGVEQYIKLLFATTTNPQYPIAVARYTNSSSPFYLFYLDGNNGAVEWYRFASVGGSGTLIATGTLSAFGNASDSLGLTISGTGTSTVIKGWKNPTGDSPSDASTWGGSGSGFTLTDDPGSPVDTGNIVGCGGTQSSASSIFIDSFFAGDIGATGYTITAAQGSYSLTGQTSSFVFNHPVTAEQGSYSLTGQDTTLVYGHPLLAEQGSYSLTGQDALLRFDSILVAEQGSYTLTGQSSNLLYGFLLVADQGSYTLTGNDSTLSYQTNNSYSIEALQGSYTLIGSEAMVDLSMIALQGSYALTGQDANLLRHWTITADQGSYGLTGQDASFIFNRLLTADAGVYDLQGQAATITYENLTHYSLTLDSGSFTLTGYDSNLLFNRVLPAEQGNYTITGISGNLIWSGAPSTARIWRHLGLAYNIGI